MMMDPKESPREVTAFATELSPSNCAYGNCRPVVVAATAGNNTTKRNLRRSSNENKNKVPMLTDFPLNKKGTNLKMRKSTSVRVMTSKQTQRVICEEFENAFLLQNGIDRQCSKPSTMMGATASPRSRHGQEHGNIAMMATTGNTDGSIKGKTALRSRAIAIKKSRHVQDAFAEEESGADASTSEMYDLATWRMYSRIIDHRRRFPVKNLYGYHRHHHQGSYPSVVAQEPRDDDTDKIESRQPSSEEHYFDGEVFDLEI